MDATAEQIDAIDLSTQGKSMKLIAFAGAGKTSTLIMIAKRLGEEGKRGLYLAFNKDIAKEAGSKLPANVEASTFHSLAYRGSPRWLTAKLGGSTLNGKAFAEYHNLSTLFVTSFVKKKGSAKKIKAKIPITTFHQKKLIDDGLNEFMITSAKQPAKRHLRKAIDTMFEHVDDNDKDYLTGRLFRAMQNIWYDYINPEGKLGIGNNHNVYLKLWALSEPVINKDFILFDEAQDADPIMIGVLLKQQCPVIYVGDAHQQIYSWRGSKNIMQNLDLPARYLTQSFRFGDELARYCQPILGYLGEKNRFKGIKNFKEPITQIDKSTYNPKDLNVALCRTNIGAVELMIKFAALGLYAVPANIQIGSTIDMLDALHEFELNPDSQARHYILKNFNDFSELLKYNQEYQGDQSIAPFLKLYQEYEYTEIKNILQRCSRLEQGDKWDFQVTTAHKAKGREWDNVLIHSDFNDSFFNEDGSAKDAPDEEYRLLYVAMTRAKKKLYAANIAKVIEIIQ